MTPSTIDDWKDQTVNSSHPNFASLQTYYRFNENTGTTTADSKNSNDGTFQGSPNWIASSGATVFSEGSWTGPNSFTSNTVSASINNITTANAGQYILTITNSGGCQSKDSFDLAVNVAPSPVTSASPAAYCDGDAINNLTATTNPPGNEANIRWYEEAGLTTLAGSGPSLAPATVVGTTVDYFVVETNGTCESSAAVQVDVTVNSNPSAPVIISNSPVCEGDSLKFSTTIDNEAGSSLLMDGSDRLAIQNFSYASNSIPAVTVETWIKTTDGTNQIIASFDRSEYWRLEINGNGGGTGQIGWGILTNGGQLDMGTTARIDDGNWHHVAAVYDNGTASIYIDGTLDNSTTRGTVFGNSVTRFGFVVVGSEATTFNGTTGPDDYFNGEIDEFRIWNAALSAAVIDEWKDKPVTSSHPQFANMDVYYRMDDNTGSVATDSKNNNDALFVSTPTWVASSTAEIFVSRSWSGPNTFSSFERNPFIENVTMAADGTYTMNLTTKEGCTSMGNADAVINDGTNYQSAQTGNWSEPATWTCNLVPTAATNIQINTGHTVTVNTASVVGNLDVVGMLGFNAGMELSVAGNLNVTGTVSAGTGKVTFNGSSAQLLDGSATVSFHDVEINNAAGVSLNQELTR